MNEFFLLNSRTGYLNKDTRFVGGIQLYKCELWGVIKTDSRLLEIFVGWEDKLAADEWYFSNAFESISKEMPPEEAFNYIPNVNEVLFKLDEDSLIWETLYFLMELYSIADTTQIHPYLESNWSPLKQHIKEYEDSYATPFKELMRQLRIKG